MKIHSKEDPLFSDIPQDLIEDFPDVEVFLLKTPQKGRINSIFVDENLEPSQVVEAIQSHKLHHVVQKNEGHFDEALKSAGMLVKNLAGYFDSQYCFSAQKPEKTRLISFTQTSDKPEMKKLAEEFVTPLKGPGVLATAEAIIEELYMNAMIDAPREAAKAGRGQKSEKCELFLCGTQNSLQISCTDPYGSLDIDHFLQRMNEVYKKGAGEAINLGPKGGAGLGCSILFEQSVCLILGVMKEKMTKVTCLVPLGKSQRKRSEMKKSLHWFEL